ncbi:MAG: hypothetical protein OCD76_16930 [Reichenbachiella sp.]
MNKYILLVLSFTLFNCTDQKGFTNEQIVTSLKHRIDSLEAEGAYFNNLDLLMDSLYEVAPDLPEAISMKIYTSFNKKSYKQVVNLCHKYFEIVPYSNANFDYCLSLERLGMLDSAKQHYSFLLNNYPDSLLNGKYTKYELITIVHGKDSALSKLKMVPDQSSYGYLRTKNDIENYIGKGLHEFIWFGTDKDFPNKYHAIIPDSLFLSGKVNNMRKLCEYFVERGINIYNTGTDIKNQAYIFSSKPQYEEKISNLKTLIITLTN